jgi:hypothetical protein
MPNDTLFPLFKLPPELLVKVLEAAVTNVNPIRRSVKEGKLGSPSTILKDDTPTYFSLLSTCRSLRDTVRSGKLYEKSNIFDFECSFTMASQLRTVSLLTISSIKHIKINANHLMDSNAQSARALRLCTGLHTLTH